MIKINKNNLKAMLISLVIMTFVIIIMKILGYSFGENQSDFKTQHLLFFDNLRNNFFVYHDFFPQIDTSLGSGQSFVTQYYHGLYNPYWILSLAFPFISTINFFRIIVLMIVVLSTFFMSILLSYHKIEGKINIITSLLCGFSFVVFSNISSQVMFIYPFPFFILSLIGLHLVLMENKKSIFIIALALILLNNYFFIIPITIILIGYYIFMILEYHIKAKEYFKKLINVVLCYVGAVLIAGIVLLPQAIFILSNGREGSGAINSNLGKIIRIEYPIDIIFDKNYLGIGIIAIFTIIAILFYLRKKSYIFMLAWIIIISLFYLINYYFNLGLYTLTKYYIFTIPIYLLLFGIALKQLLINKTKVTSLFLITIIAFCLILLEKTLLTHAPLDYKLIGLNIVQLLLILSFLIPIKHQGTYILVCIYILGVFYNFNKYLSDKTIRNEILYTKLDKKLEKELSKQKNADLYRTIYPLNKSNMIANSPNYYSSLIVENYSRMYSLIGIEQTYGTTRRIDKTQFSDIFSRKLFSTRFRLEENNFSIYNYVDKAYINGVENKYIMNDSYLKEKNINTYPSLMTNVFVDKYNSNKKINEIKYQNIIDIFPKNIILKEGQTSKINIARNLEEGLILIELELDKINTKREFAIDLEISTNLGKKQNISTTDYFVYGDNNNKRMLFYIDVNEKTKHLNFDNRAIYNIKWGDLNIKIKDVRYYSLEDIEKEEFKYTNPNNITVIPNRGWQTKINMKEKGILNTSIPYDENMRIEINGNPAELLKVNKMFVGASLEKGNSDIKITYHIPYFKVAVGSSIIGLIVLGFVIVYDSKRREAV